MSKSTQEIIVVGCLIWNNDKFLLLQRQDHKPEGRKWGIPAGKVDPNEDEEQALLREVKEETGITLQSKSLRKFHNGVWNVSDRHIRFHSFEATLPADQRVSISAEEHKTFDWCTKEETLRNYDLIHEGWFREVFSL